MQQDAFVSAEPRPGLDNEAGVAPSEIQRERLDLVLKSKSDCLCTL